MKPSNHQSSYRIARFESGTRKIKPAVTALLAISISIASAGKGGGGKPRGEDGGDGILEHSVPPVVPPPVGYLNTKLWWPEEIDPETGDFYPTFQGINVYSINSRGLAVGCVKLSPPEGSPERSYGERRGVINLGSNGEATDTLVDLNLVFADALTNLNTIRASGPWHDGPWRIAYGQQINEAGQIGCTLIPDSEVVAAHTELAATLGIDPVPRLLAMADLEDMTLLPVEPGNTSPDQDIMDLNQAGDLLVRDRAAHIARLYVFHPDNPVTPTVDAGYLEYSLPEYTPGAVTFNSSLQVTWDETVTGKGRSVSELLYRSSLTTDGEEYFWMDDLLWQREGKDYDYMYFSHTYGVAEDGSVYTAAGGFGTSIPYHVISPTERTPLTDVNATGVWNDGMSHYRSLSKAQTSGEEEILLHLCETTGDYQIYKPNFGARFVLPLAPHTLIWASISPPPIDDGQQSAPYDQGYTGDYLGGYIVYMDCLDTHTSGSRANSYILTPDGATPPVIVTGN